MVTLLVDHVYEVVCVLKVLDGELPPSVSGCIFSELADDGFELIEAIIFDVECFEKFIDFDGSIDVVHLFIDFDGID